MCYDLEKYERAKTAKTDLHVFKFYEKYGGKFRSPYQGMVVKAGQTLRKVKLVKSKECPLVVITEGYHCCIERSFFWLGGWDEDYCLVSVIVPKGTRYYSNHEQLVAEQIIVNEEVT